MKWKAYGMEPIFAASKLAPFIAKQAFSLIKDPVLKAIGMDSLSKFLREANHQFGFLFEQELEYRDILPTLMQASSNDEVAVFCASDTIQSILAEPVRGASELDWRQLASTWVEFRKNDGTKLMSLPEDFDWNKVCVKYVKTIRSLMVSSSEMRTLLNAQNSELAKDRLTRLVGVTPEFDLDRYRQILKNEYGILRLGSLDADWSKYSLRLRSIYVPQTVKEALPLREVTRDYLKRLGAEGRLFDFARQESHDLVRSDYQRAPSRALLDVVDAMDCRRVVILGDPGLGKSTLLQSLCLRWAETDKGPFPILIELRRYANEPVSSKGFLGFLEESIWTRCKFPEIELDRHLKMADSIVMFDGLDEMFDPVRRAAAVTEIVRFADEYPRARIVVTTRIVGYHPGSRHPEEFRNAGFRQFTLQDFESGEIEKFIHSWHRAAFPTSLEERVRYQGRLEKAVLESPSIRELAGNPLLLTMMAMLNRNQDLPRERSKLYEECGELLLHDWETDKFPEGRDRIGPQQKQRMLQRVAYSMQSERSGIAGNLISEDRLREILTAHLQELGISEVWQIASDLIEKLHERNFMLSYLGDRQYAFVHRTFLEYFCAREYQFQFQRTSGLKIEALRQLFAGRWKRDEWNEVLRLISGLVGAEYASELIEELLKYADQSDGWRAVFLASDCLSEVQELGLISSVRMKVKTQLQHLIKESSDQEVVNQHFYNIHQVLSGAVTRIARGWKELPETFSWLEQLVVESDIWVLRQGALSELVRGWGQQPETLQLIKAFGVNDQDEDVRRIALQALIKSWANDSGLIEVLKKAVQDDDETIREVAVEGLVSACSDLPEVLRLLQICANDPSANVRRASLLGLASKWKNDADTYKRLMAAADDSDEDVRRAVVVQLVQSWASEPEVVEALKRKARDDRDQGIRELALEQLAANWKTDSETLRILQESATADKGNDVRRAALRELVTGWKDNPETLRILNECAAGDQVDKVREAALEELARGWPYGVAVQGILVDRIGNDKKPSVRAKAITELAKSRTSDAGILDLIKSKISDDGSSVVRIAAIKGLELMGCAGEDAFLLLESRVISDTNRDVRGKALQLLVDNWNSDDRVTQLLKKVPVDDDDANLRVYALRSLALGSKSDESVRSLLTTKANSDGDERVRRVAIEELARGWADSTSFEQLSSIVRNDADRDVRIAAVTELAANWKDDPNVVAVIKDTCSNDQDRDVRRMALKILSDTWSDDSEIVIWAKDRRCGDKSRAVQTNTSEEEHYELVGLPMLPVNMGISGPRHYFRYVRRP